MGPALTVPDMMLTVQPAGSLQRGSHSSHVRQPEAELNLPSTELKELGDAAFQRQEFAAAVGAYSAALASLSAPSTDSDLRSTLLANRCLARLKSSQDFGAQTQPAEVAAALEDAREAARLRPRWGKAHLRLAQCLEAAGRPEPAAAAYRRAAELDDGLAPAVSRALAGLERQAARQRCLLVLQGHSGAIYDAAIQPHVSRVNCLMCYWRGILDGFSVDQTAGIPSLLAGCCQSP